MKIAFTPVVYEHAARFVGRTPWEVSRDADLLFVEAAFLERDAEHGRRKFHLTARQAGEIARAANAGCVIPLHFSPRYMGEDVALLRAEVAAAYGGKVL